MTVTTTQQAWEQAFRDHHQAVFTFARLRGLDHQTAEDVAAVAFWRCRDRIGSVDNPRAYLFRAVVNGARDAHRRAVVRSIEPPAPPTIADPVGDAMLLTVEQRLVRDAVGGLSPMQRDCVLLRYWQDLSEREVGEVLGISRSSVAKHLTRALDRLTPILEEAHD